MKNPCHWTYYIVTSHTDAEIVCCRIIWSGRRCGAINVRQSPVYETRRANYRPPSYPCRVSCYSFTLSAEWRTTMAEPSSGEALLPAPCQTVTGRREITTCQRYGHHRNSLQSPETSPRLVMDGRSVKYADRRNCGPSDCSWEGRNLILGDISARSVDTVNRVSVCGWRWNPSVAADSSSPVVAQQGVVWTQLRRSTYGYVESGGGLLGARMLWAVQYHRTCSVSSMHRLTAAGANSQSNCRILRASTTFLTDSISWHAKTQYKFWRLCANNASRLKSVRSNVKAFKGWFFKTLWLSFCYRA